MLKPIFLLGTFMVAQSAMSGIFADRPTRVAVAFKHASLQDHGTGQSVHARLRTETFTQSALSQGQAAQLWEIVSLDLLVSTPKQMQTSSGGRFHGFMGGTVVSFAGNKELYDNAQGSNVFNVLQLSEIDRSLSLIGTTIESGTSQASSQEIIFPQAVFSQDSVVSLGSIQLLMRPVQIVGDSHDDVNEVTVNLFDDIARSIPSANFSTIKLDF